MKTKPLFTLATMATLSATIECAAQYKSFTMEQRAAEVRTGRMEIYAAGQYWHAESATAHNIQVNLPPPTIGDLRLEFDDTGLWGFGLIYHFNEHLAVNGEFMFGYPDYSMTFQNSRLSGEAFIHTGKFNVEYNIFPGRLTPFIGGGVGYFYIDSNIPSGPPDIYCWWDEWWGGACSTFPNTYTQAYFAANAAVGLRWDVTDMISLRLYGGGNFVLVDQEIDWLSTIQVGLSVGWKF